MRKLYAAKAFKYKGLVFKMRKDKNFKQGNEKLTAAAPGNSTAWNKLIKGKLLRSGFEFLDHNCLKEELIECAYLLCALCDVKQKELSENVLQLLQISSDSSKDDCYDTETDFENKFLNSIKIRSWETLVVSFCQKTRLIAFYLQVGATLNFAETCKWATCFSDLLEIAGKLKHRVISKMKTDSWKDRVKHYFSSMGKRKNLSTIIQSATPIDIFKCLGEILTRQAKSEQARISVCDPITTLHQPFNLQLQPYLFFLIQLQFLIAELSLEAGEFAPALTRHQKLLNDVRRMVSCTIESNENYPLNLKLKEHLNEYVTLVINYAAESRKKKLTEDTAQNTLSEIVRRCLIVQKNLHLTYNSLNSANKLDTFINNPQLNNEVAKKTITQEKETEYRRRLGKLYDTFRSIKPDLLERKLANTYVGLEWPSGKLFHSGTDIAKLVKDAGKKYLDDEVFYFYVSTDQDLNGDVDSTDLLIPFRPMI